MRLLIVDDEKNARDGLSAALSGSYAVTVAASGAEAIGLLTAAVPPIDLVLADLRMAGKTGLDVVAFCRGLSPSPSCILMTAYGDIGTAVRAMKQGAADFLPKPLDLDAVEGALRRAAEERFPSIQREKLMDSGGMVIGKSAAMDKLMETVRLVAATDSTALLVGETGVGKEMIAREIHRLSQRSEEPFLAINGAAIPHDMVESALFGHERGAFTDASRLHRGYFERAGGGTLLLDEVSELPPETQVKLLRVLETRSFERLGGQQPIPVSLRLIAATNVPLEERVRSGQFRSDLYYRLCVIPLAIPPLRDRPEDIPPLLEHFWGQWRNRPSVDSGALAILKKYRWPGNVRELRNFCEAMAVLRSGSIISPKDLDGRFFANEESASGKPIAIAPVANCDRSQIIRALEEAGGNRAKAAKILSVGRSTLYRHMRSNGIA
ncbi:MAG: sigma-54 dependent transcriptional regulator [Puniceicoccales bacterium]|nr:sigma-54 dependent transcriptional regulator [Puniceicoccales bacterium]